MQQTRGFRCFASHYRHDYRILYEQGIKIYIGLDDKKLVMIHLDTNKGNLILNIHSHWHKEQVNPEQS